MKTAETEPLNTHHMIPWRQQRQSHSTHTTWSHEDSRDRATQHTPHDPMKTAETQPLNTHHMIPWREQRDRATQHTPHDPMKTTETEPFNTHHMIPWSFPALSRSYTQHSHVWGRGSHLCQTASVTRGWLTSATKPLWSSLKFLTSAVGRTKYHRSGEVSPWCPCTRKGRTGRKPPATAPSVWPAALWRLERAVNSRLM